jgi:signal transduction histidine kinase
MPGTRLRADQIVSLVALHGRVADDLDGAVAQLPGAVRDLDGEVYAVPVRVGDALAGCMLVLVDHALSPTERTTIQEAATAGALDVVLHAAEHRMRLNARVTEALGEISHGVARSAQLPTVVPGIASLAARSLGFTRASVLLLGGDGHLSVAASQFAGGQPDVRVWGALRSLSPIPEAFLDALSASRPLVFTQPESTPSLQPQAWIRLFGIKTVVIAAIRLGDQPLGLLILDDERRRSVAEEEAAGAAMIARAAGDALATIDLLQDERAVLHRSQLVLATVVQAATQLNTSGVLTVIGEGINKVLGDATTVSFVVDDGIPSRLVVCGLGDGVLEIVDRVVEAFPGGGPGTGSDFIVMSVSSHPTILGGTVAGRAVALPLRRAARDLGWVVSFSPEDAPYADQDLKIVAGIAAQAALSLHTALLLEQERATVSRLEELGDLKTQFVASVSHELRTPLTAIIGYTELMLEILDDPTLRTYLDDMRRESTALEALINDLLDTSRIESGTLRLEIKIDDPVRALHEAVELVRHTHPGRAVSVDVEAGTGTIPIDHGRLRQIITNLLDNAVKYSPEDSVVSVVMRRVTDAQRGEHVEVTVSDRGPGIPVGQREAVFQRFNRLHTATHAGTGIGLYLVRALVEAHGGSVKVADGVGGGGSRFIVRLPATAGSH